MVNTDDLSVVALIISLVALFTTLVQVLQQYYATADGYRRCQSSVMAGWAQFTKRKFRWSEFRFETIFVVPDITFLMIEAVDDPGLDNELEYQGDKSKTPSRNSHTSALERGVVGRTRKIYRSKTPTQSSINQDWTDSGRRMVLFEEPSHWSDGDYRSFRKGFDCGGFDKGSEPQRKNYFQRDPYEESQAKPAKDSLKWSLWDIYDGFESRFTNVNNTDRACWVRLMTRLFYLQQDLQRDSRDEFLNAGVVPAFSGRQRSWDFMPPDIIRPYITMSICDLIIIARLLQMKWTLFDPQKGALRAEGHDCLMESRVLPSVGTMIDFKPIRSKLSADGSSVTERWYIPKPESYRMIFGIIPADPGLTTFAESGFRVSAERGDITEWHRTLSEILRACGVDSFVGDIDYLAADLLPLVAPMLRNLHSPIIKLPQPYHNKDSWIGLRRAFNAFPVELERLIEKQDALGSSTGDIVMNTPLLLKEILEAAQEMRKEPHLKYWNKPWPHRLKGLETEIISFCDLVSTKFEIAQQYLIRLLKDYNIPHFYEEMVVSHLVLLTRSNEVSPTREGREKKTLLGNIRRNNKPQEQMRYMFDHLDELSSVLQKRYPSLAKIEISNAWVAMMWRGMCWRRCHGPEWEDDLPVPSQYWCSKQEVHIG